MSAEDYVLGRGELHFAPFLPGTQKPSGYRYIGNTPEVSLSAAVDKLEHYNSDRGLKKKDATAYLQTNYTVSIATDEITSDNMAMFLFSENGAQIISDSGTTITGELINSVLVGRSYQLGETDSHPVGNMNISNTGLVVKNDAATPVTYSAGDDFVIDHVRGLLTILDGGDITDGTNLKVDYVTTASTHELVVSGGKPVEGALKFITHNAAGPDAVYTMPWVQIAPNGDMNFKGDDWQQIPLTGDILNKGALEAIYRNGLPFVPTP